MHLEFRYKFSLYIPSHGAKIKDVHGLSDWKQIGKKTAQEVQAICQLPDRTDGQDCLASRNQI